MDARRLAPRTDALLADPRLAAAAQRLGSDLVRRGQARAGAGPLGCIAAAAVADAAVTAMPARASTLTR